MGCQRGLKHCIEVFLLILTMACEVDSLSILIQLFTLCKWRLERLAKNSLSFSVTQAVDLSKDLRTVCTTAWVGGVSGKRLEPGLSMEFAGHRLWWRCGWTFSGRTSLSLPHHHKPVSQNWVKTPSPLSCGEKPRPSAHDWIMKALVSDC